MTILFNGAKHETAARTVSELLREAGAPARGVAVALNGAVVRRAEHDVTALQAGDTVELIRAVQGG